MALHCLKQMVQITYGTLTGIHTAITLVETNCSKLHYGILIGISTGITGLETNGEKLHMALKQAYILALHYLKQMGANYTMAF